MPKILTLTIISNHLEILTRCKSAEERLFYILYTHREHLKYKELKRVITNDAYGSLVGGDKSNLSQTQVEYALSRSMSPTMVAEYKRLLIPKEVLQSKIEEYAQIALDDTKDDAGKNLN